MPTADRVFLDTNIVKSFDNVESFRNSSEAQQLTRDWIAEQRLGDVTGENHMNLLAWITFHPVYALAIILNLLNATKDDEEVMEQVALGPVTQIVESSPEDFLPVLRLAIKKHSLFELCTRACREFGDTPRWRELARIYEN